jgi:uncharacterized protein
VDTRKILDFLENHRETLQAMGVKRIGLFGSYVRNEQKEDSDIDFLITMDNLNFANWMDVWNYLEDNLGCEIDLVPEKDLREELQDVVLAEVAYVEVA